MSSGDIEVACDGEPNRVTAALHQALQAAYGIVASESWIEHGKAAPEELSYIRDLLEEATSYELAPILSQRSHTSLMMLLLSAMSQKLDPELASVFQKELLEPVRTALATVDTLVELSRGEVLPESPPKADANGADGGRESPVPPPLQYCYLLSAAVAANVDGGNSSSHQPMGGTTSTKGSRTQFAQLCRLPLSVLFPQAPSPHQSTWLTEESDVVRRTYSSIFTQLGELPNYYALIGGTFPTLLQRHHQAIQFLLFGEGPLQPASSRLLVAMMAAADHDNQYLFRRFATLYSTMAGDLAPRPWLYGEFPEKLKALRRLSSLMAHRPWGIQSEVIRDLAKEHGWQTPELLQAMGILATVHALAGFTEVNMIHLDSSTAVVPEAVAALPTPSLGSSPTSALPAAPPPRFSVGTGFLDPEQSVKYEKRINKGAAGHNGGLNIADYNWDDHASTLMERYYEGAASLITEETQHCESLCDTVGEDVDSSVIKNPEKYSVAVWWWNVRLYVLNAYGVIFDEFNAEVVNEILHLEVKRFIHRINCTPEDATLLDVHWDACSGVAPVHKLLLGLVVMQARRMAELILASYAVQQYLETS